MKHQILHLLLGCCAFLTMRVSVAQDTFSIVALDSTTGEVGSAGASCVDLDLTLFIYDHFIGKLFPEKGAINTQASYLQTNQNNATARMNAGDSPQEIIDWLVENDVDDTPEHRQYGIVAMVDGSPESAAYTGTSTLDYKGHITGPGYSIQGNILMGQQVLDSMEARFLNAEGDLACKLMAALQGANMVGADSRCASNNSSSLFAYVKVAQPEDDFGDPSFMVSVRTNNNDSIEPIDSLQIKFNAVHSCTPDTADSITFIQVHTSDNRYDLFPNPTHRQINVQRRTGANQSAEVRLMNVLGKTYFTQNFEQQTELDVVNLPAGTYIIQITDSKGVYVRKFVKR